MFSRLSASPAVMRQRIDGMILKSRTASSNSFLKLSLRLKSCNSFKCSLKKLKYLATVSSQFSLLPLSGNHLEYLDK